MAYHRLIKTSSTQTLTEFTNSGLQRIYCFFYMFQSLVAIIMEIIQSVKWKLLVLTLKVVLCQLISLMRAECG